MDSSQTAAFVDFLFPVLVAVVLVMAGVIVLRSNKKNRVVWKFPVAWFGIVIGAVFAVGSVPYLMEFVATFETETVTATPTTEASTSTSTTIAPPTTVPSKYKVISAQDAFAWAVDAVGYAETKAWRWDSKDDATIFAQQLAARICRSLAPPSDGRWIILGPDAIAPEMTVEQAEAKLRADMGIERWEAYGEGWYDSLVNGLCIR